MSKKILVIDDDHLVVRTLARLLESEGFEVSCAETGFKAIELIEQVDFDLIISDIRMPGKDGIETGTDIKEILQKHNKKAIPIIFITGYSDNQKYNEAQKLAPSDFIYKPFDKGKFVNSIKKVLQD